LEAIESYHTLQLKPKAIPEFKDALQLIWRYCLRYWRKPLTTPRKNLQSASDGHFERKIIICDNKWRGILFCEFYEHHI